MTSELRAVADECCGGRLVAVTEGGYDLKALSESLQRVVEVLAADTAGGAAMAGGRVGFADQRQGRRRADQGGAGVVLAALDAITGADDRDRRTLPWTSPRSNDANTVVARART